MTATNESKRISAGYAPDTQEKWLKWGTYLSERQWGTVREDYSAGGNAWDYFSHEQSRSRAYRWGEDGLAGFSDRRQKLCFSLALWNENDPILKERLFGLTNGEGNHGEDVKEYYYYTDNTPTHSYAKWQYKYPQGAFPYEDLVRTNGSRSKSEGEYELIDTGIFNKNRYFDIQVEYAKNTPEDVLINITVKNQSKTPATAYLLPTLLFRNTWTWVENGTKPSLKGSFNKGGVSTIDITPANESDDPCPLSPMKLYCQGADELLFVDNETNDRKLWGNTTSPAHPKDGINDYIIHDASTVNPDLSGTKASALYRLTLAGGESKTITLRLSDNTSLADPFADFDNILAARISDADAFYAALPAQPESDDQKLIMRQAYAGMLWNKQFYYYIVKDWLKGDPTQPPPPEGRSRNKNWKHFYASDVLSMPDPWEYPWFASWDLCFHTVVLARIDVQFAKDQLITLAREWYMTPGGAIPAYEWAFDDVNPPLHAWAALQIYKTEKEAIGGDGDTAFLEDIFRYSLMYFTWWMNRKDTDQSDLFQGGFLGLDNISIIDRSNLDALEQQIGRAVEIYQSDGTSWMALFSLNMMEIGLVLAKAGHKEYGRFANKFFQNFVFIADSLNALEDKSDSQVKLWDDNDGFYYDALKVHGGGREDEYISIKLRSLVGLITLTPVLAVDIDAIEAGTAAQLQEKMNWFYKQHPELVKHTITKHASDDSRQLISLVDPDRLRVILQRMLDESEFLSEYGIRSLSKSHETPYDLQVDSAHLTAKYEPAESSNGLFGGNSNWRGPIWFPINFILIDSLYRYYDFLGDDYKVEYPTHSNNYLNLKEVADKISERLIKIFERNGDGNRPVFGGVETFQKDPAWNNGIFFYEYFHGDNGAGIGASHQTGWTGLVAELMHKLNK